MPTERPTQFDLRAWLETAFRREVPESVENLLKERKAAQNCFEELMTQLPSDVHPVVEALYELQKTEAETQYLVIQELFLRHLDQHQTSA